MSENSASHDKRHPQPHRWTTDDFDSLSWHDCHVHGLRLANYNEDFGTADLVLDIDFIVEWLVQSDRAIRFRVAPATLTFHEVFGLRIQIDYTALGFGVAPFSLSRIDREALNGHSGRASYRWWLPLNFPGGEITFESPGFMQALRREPVIIDSQSLTTAERDR